MNLSDKSFTFCYWGMIENLCTHPLVRNEILDHAFVWQYWIHPHLLWRKSSLLNLRALISHFYLHQGETALDTLRQWQRTYSRELDHETRQKCIATERLLRKALAGGGEALASSHCVSLGLPFYTCFQTLVFLTYLCRPQCLQLRPRPSLLMPCRTASCLMRRVLSHSRPLEGALPPAKTGREAGARRWKRQAPAANSGRPMAQHSGTEPGEQKLLYCMG